MALCSIAVHDTVDNGRTCLTEKTLKSYTTTVNWDRHRLFLCDNNSCDATQELYNRAKDWLPFTLIRNESNIGTARAINKAWKHRKTGEAALKGDNDVVIHQEGWLDILEECIERDDGIKFGDGYSRRMGICALKRKDLDEWVLNTRGRWDHSFFHPLPHDKAKGERWLTVEVVNHAMGTCCLFNSTLLDKIGYLYQMGGTYGLDDGLAAVRAHAAGFYSCFWPWTEIDHIDAGGTPYTEWKRDYVMKEEVTYKGEKMSRMEQFNRLKREYLTGERSFYHGPDDQ